MYYNLLVLMQIILTDSLPQLYSVRNREKSNNLYSQFFCDKLSKCTPDNVKVCGYDDELFLLAEFEDICIFYRINCRGQGRYRVIPNVVCDHKKEYSAREGTEMEWSHVYPLNITTGHYNSTVSVTKLGQADADKDEEYHENLNDAEPTAEVKYDVVTVVPPIRMQLVLMYPFDLSSSIVITTLLVYSISMKKCLTLLIIKKIPVNQTFFLRANNDVIEWQAEDKENPFHAFHCFRLKICEPGGSIVCGEEYKSGKDENEKILYVQFSDSCVFHFVNCNEFGAYKEVELGNCNNAQFEFTYRSIDEWINSKPEDRKLFAPYTTINKIDKKGEIEDEAIPPTTLCLQVLLANDEITYEQWKINDISSDPFHNFHCFRVKICKAGGGSICAEKENVHGSYASFEDSCLFHFVNCHRLAVFHEVDTKFCDHVKVAFSYQSLEAYVDSSDKADIDPFFTYVL